MAQTGTGEVGFRAIVLGCAQDAGIPSIGCSCSRCSHARALGSAYKDGMVACLGLVDDGDRKAFLVDATPDIGSQLWELQQAIPAKSDASSDDRDGGSSDGPGNVLGGILLTHAHMGHYSGLLQLGKEALGAAQVPVFCTASMAAFLHENLPWSLLVEGNSIVITELTPGSAYRLCTGLCVTPISVPHRDEISDTVAMLFSCGDQSKLLYCPDTNGWGEGWGKGIRAWCDEVEVAVVDGTFYSADELPAGRSIADIPHPLIPDTVARLSGCSAQVVFTHLNHTNPVATAASEQRRSVTDAGMSVAEFGMQWCFSAPAQSSMTAAEVTAAAAVDAAAAAPAAAAAAVGGGETIVDWEAAVEQCAGDEEFLRELLLDLWNELQEHLEELSTTIPEGNIERSGRIGHSIKGAAANLMCYRLKDAALAMERVGHAAAAKAKPPDQLQADLEATYEALKGEAATYEAYLKTLERL